MRSRNRRYRMSHYGATRLEERQAKQDNPHSWVRIVAGALSTGLSAGLGSEMYFEAILSARVVEHVGDKEKVAKTMIDRELRKRKLVRVERPFIHDDFLMA